MAVSKGLDNLDSWDQPFTSSSRIPPKDTLMTRRRTAPVPDDWDNDDDDDDKDNQEIWEDANSNTQSPMPEVVVVRSSSTTPSIVAHPSVFQSPMRILKRPSNSQSSSASSLSSATDSQSHQSLAEREARYQAARERIFGEERAGKGPDALGKEASRATTTVVRNLRGPSSSADGEGKAGSIAKGFESRSKDTGLRPTLEPPSK